MVTLKKLRKEAGKTQQQMADLLEISQQAYAAYENDAAQPPINVIKKLAAFFGVTIDYLVENNDLPEGHFHIPPILERAQLAYSGDSRMTQEKIDEIARFAEFLLSKDSK